jgi:hypothetical protein
MKKILVLVLAFGAIANAVSYGDTRQKVVQIVEQIRRADYEGNRAALKQLYEELSPYKDDKIRASRVRYWRRFAMWRHVINGFNEAAIDPKELEADLTLGIDEFQVRAQKIQHL